MKIFKFYYLFFIAAFGMIVSSCGKDDITDTNQITITIEEPIDDEVLTDCGEVHVHIDIAATVEIHEVEIILHPKGDLADKIINYDEHDHGDILITFAQELDLCAYSAGTCFHLEVSACLDHHDCAEKASTDIEFCLQ